MMLAALLLSCRPHGDPCGDLRFSLALFSDTVSVGELRHREWPGPGWVSADEVNKSFAPVNRVKGTEFLYDPITKVQCTRFRGLHLCNQEFDGHPADMCWSE